MASKYTFTSSLRELRFLFCQTSSQSSATRSFLLRAYPTMKHHNPSTPILIREAADTPPRVWARYEYGRETYRDLEGLGEKEVEGVVSELVRAEAPKA